jgi:hypothetical protein
MAEYSQWYPYLNIQDSYNDMSQSVKLPRIICDYLIDAPKGDYTPADNNLYSRCRFWKYLYYDGANPLNERLPDIEEKMSVVFNPNAPENPPTDKGYRLIPEIWVKQSQIKAQTRVYIYLGREVPNDDFKTVVAVHFAIWSHYTYENNTKAEAYSRTVAIEQSLIEALVGVNMTGIGTFHFNKRQHSDCQGRPIFDGDINVGRELVLGLELATVANSSINGTDNMPNYTSDGKIKLW